MTVESFLYFFFFSVGGVGASRCDISERKTRARTHAPHTHTRPAQLSSGALSSVLFVLSTYSQSQFPHQPSLRLLRVQADTSSCRLPHFWNLSNLSWESQPPSHHPGAYGPLSIYPPLPSTLLPFLLLFSTFISHPNLPVATSSASSKFCLLFSSILSPHSCRLPLTPPWKKPPNKQTNKKKTFPPAYFALRSALPTMWIEDNHARQRMTSHTEFQVARDRSKPNIRWLF